MLLKPEKCREALAILKQTYPEAKPALHFSTPYELLTATMLSAQCTDKMVNKVTEVLFARANTPEQMQSLSYEELCGYIHSCGFYRMKAQHILETAGILVERFNGEVPSDREDLEALPGVGRKTANVVLSVGFGHQRLAVDTHVFRVANRIGFVCEKDVLETELALMEVIPENRWTRTHHSLIFHGRNCCDARKPKCTECPINQYCKYYKEAGN